MTRCRSRQFLPFACVVLAVGAVLSCVSASRAAAAGRDFDVSPAADDASGGSESNPSATIARAQAAVRALRLAEQPLGPVTACLRGGLRAITEKLVFCPQDSGTADSPVTYRSYPGEGTFQLTDEAAWSGAKSAGCTDRKDLAQSFYPRDRP